jgi:hypothetical protein
MDNVERLPGRRIRHILKAFLVSKAWNPESVFCSATPVEIEAKRGTDRWIIEVYDSESLNPAIANAFVSALGRALQKMSDPSCKYSVAFPDSKPFHRLWGRLPALAKARTGITALFVDQTGKVIEISR